MAPSLITTLFFAALAASSPAPSAPAGHEYKPAGKGDVRSPCPGLNSLANHGWIHHNGKGMTIPHLIAGGAGMNIGTDFMTAIGGAGILSNPKQPSNSFDLDHLNEHNFPIEHDGSLTRQDHHFGQWYRLHGREYKQWISQFGDAKKTSIKSASLAKYTRVNDSLARNPEVVYGPREFVLSYGETGLYLQTMGSDVVSGVARLDYIREFFLLQKLPYELGWKPPTLPVTLASLAAMAVRLNAANGEALPEGLEVLSVGAFADAFAGKDPVTGKLANATCGLLGTC